MLPFGFISENDSDIIQPEKLGDDNLWFEKNAFDKLLR